MNEEENLYKRCDVMHFWNCNSASGIQVSWLAKFNILEDHLGFMGKTSSLVKKKHNQHSKFYVVSTNFSQITESIVWQAICKMHLISFNISWFL